MDNRLKGEQMTALGLFLVCIAGAAIGGIFAFNASDDETIRTVKYILAWPVPEGFESDVTVGRFDGKRTIVAGLYDTESDWWEERMIPAGSGCAKVGRILDAMVESVRQDEEAESTEDYTPGTYYGGRSEWN